MQSAPRRPAGPQRHRRWTDRDRVFGLCLWHPSSKLLRQRQDKESTLRCQTWPGLPWFRLFLTMMAAPFLHTYDVPGTFKYISMYSLISSSQWPRESRNYITNAPEKTGPKKLLSGRDKIWTRILLTLKSLLCPLSQPVSWWSVGSHPIDIPKFGPHLLTIEELVSKWGSPVLGVISVLQQQIGRPRSSPSATILSFLSSFQLSEFPLFMH